MAKEAGIYEHLYGDINEELNHYLSRKPKGSLTDLFPLTYPDS